MNAKFRGLGVTLPLFFVGLVAGTSATAKDRYKLASQPQVFLIHHTAKRNFLVESSGYRVAAGSISTLLQMNESARLQQKLDLEDPVRYGKDRLAERLRSDLALQNLTVLREPSNMPVILEEVEAAQPPSNSPGFSRQESAATVQAADTFQKRNPSGVVIEMVTQHWGIDNYKTKYYADFRVISLTNAKVLQKLRCSWVILEVVDLKKLEAADPNFDRLNGSHVEEKLFADNGALVKASLRKAAEQCVDKVMPRFL